MSAMVDGTGEFPMSTDANLASAREQLQAALDVLGSRGEETVLDSTLLGAARLAFDAAEILRRIHRKRTHAATT